MISAFIISNNKFYIVRLSVTMNIKYTLQNLFFYYTSTLIFFIQNFKTRTYEHLPIDSLRFVINFTVKFAYAFICFATSSAKFSLFFSMPSPVS